MKKISIKLVILGNLKFRIDFNKILKWKSFLFDISEPNFVNLLPNSETNDWVYYDSQLTNILKPDSSYDITIGIINSELEGNYYIRRLTENSAVLSLFETGEILKNENLELENFIIRNLYEFALVFHLYDGSVPKSAYSVTHDETRGCIFDMNAYKPDIVFSNEKVGLCDECRTKFSKKAVTKNFMKDLDKELNRIKKSFYYRIIDWIKIHPIISIIITIITSLVINILSNLISGLFT